MVQEPTGEGERHTRGGRQAPVTAKWSSLMAGLIHPDCGMQTDYRGLNAIFEYCNQDGTLVRTNCGQCAAATFLTHYGKLARDLDQAADIIADIEKHFPPDNVAGILGTSRRRVVLICHAHGLKADAIEGE